MLTYDCAVTKNEMSVLRKPFFSVAARWLLSFIDIYHFNDTHCRTFAFRNGEKAKADRERHKRNEKRNSRQFARPFPNNFVKHLVQQHIYSLIRRVAIVISNNSSDGDSGHGGSYDDEDHKEFEFTELWIFFRRDENVHVIDRIIVATDSHTCESARDFIPFWW